MVLSGGWIYLLADITASTVRRHVAPRWGIGSRAQSSMAIAHVLGKLGEVIDELEEIQESAAFCYLCALELNLELVQRAAQSLEGFLQLRIQKVLVVLIDFV